MLKLHQLYLRKFIVLFLVLFITVGGVVYFWAKDFYIDQTKNSILQNIELLSYNIDNIDKITKVAKKIKDDLNLRLTLIDQDGTVLCESHKDKKTMDNHKYRQEIKEANIKKYGYTIRYSNTLHKELLYVVKRYKVKGRYIYIRISKEVEGINQEIISLGIKVSVVLILFFIMLFLAAYKISRQIQDETNKILQFLLDFTKNKKSSYISSDFSYEFNKITKLLTKVSTILTKKDKQKAKYTSKLKNSNKQKDDIISAIAHEFKNPIAIINGYAQTLLEDKNINKNIQNKFLNKIYKSGNRLSSLIDTLRLSVKLDDGKQILNYSSFDLYEFIEDNIETIKLNYKNREIRLDGEKGITIKADKTLFSVAVINLIENALKYSEDDVVVKLDKKSISIIDKGIGLESSDIQKITNKFYRVSSNSWNNSLGLGLFIVSNILQLHKFKLDIKSRHTQGSKFSIII